MKRFLLDTNVLSEFRKKKPHGAVVTWFDSLRQEQAFVAAVTFGELQAGIEKTRRQDALKAQELEQWLDLIQATARILVMDADCFREWGRLMERKSGDLTEDAMIAATARCHGLIVATRNERDFAQFGIEVFNPFKH